jgi:hypothetical protein
MKKLLSLLMITMLLTLCACSGKKTTATPSPLPSGTSNGQGVITAASAPSAPAPAASVTGAVAYVLSTSAAESSVYGAIEYENTGNCYVYLSSASLTFTCGDVEFSEEFQPLTGASDVLAPGESSYIAVWTSTGKQLPENTSITVNPTLNVTQCGQTRIQLRTGNLFISENYPGIGTVTGTVFNDNDSDCPINMIYLGFYDKDSKLLGVWYFTKDAAIPADGNKTFVENMNGLPIKDLSANTESIRGHAFGIM